MESAKNGKNIQTCSKTGRRRQSRKKIWFWSLFKRNLKRTMEGDKIGKKHPNLLYTDGLTFPEKVWAKGSSKSGGMLYIFTCSSLHILTCSHTHIFTKLTPSHLFTFTHAHIFTSFDLHIFTSSHLHPSHIFSLSLSLSLFTFTSSHLLTFTYLHLHIFSSSHLLIFTSSHLLTLSLSLSLSLSISLSLSFLSLRQQAVPTMRHNMATRSHEMKFGCQN